MTPKHSGRLAAFFFFLAFLTFLVMVFGSRY